MPAYVIGLMSGTSHDGVDAVLVRCGGEPPHLRWKILSYLRSRYPHSLRERIHRLLSATSSPAEIAALNVLLGEFFAKVADRISSRAGVPLSQVSLIGSHGQTVYHKAPSRKGQHGVTFQIGEPCVIAERTGVTTIADFRQRDMAAGGTGAPLVPAVEDLLLRDKRVARAFLNIGGIANITALPPLNSREKAFAFDTGPGNSLIDEAVRIESRGRMTYDRDGRMASTGKINDELLRTLMDHPYLMKAPPKATGREEFGTSYLLALIDFAGLGPREKGDVVTTLTHFTAASIHDAFRRFVQPRCSAHELYVSGGGIRNRTLISHLRSLFKTDGVVVSSTEKLGIHPLAKEAFCFAVLAWLSARGMPGNLPSVTGASRAVVLGKISPGRDCRIACPS